MKRKNTQMVFQLSNRGILKMAIAGAALSLIANIAYGQSNVTGSVYGSAPAGSVVTVRSADTGFIQKVAVRSDGSFNFPTLPVGQYEVTATVGGSEVASQSVAVGIGAGANVLLVPVPGAKGGDVQLEAVTVRGSAPVVDTRSVETSTNLTAKQLSQIPVGRNTTAVQLLAPDAVQGDRAFTTQQGQALVSFGGSSPLENAYFLNGFNITDFRKGLGGAEVPFEFYKEVQVKTGGYSAEFGRSLGGVVNSVARSGTNKFEVGVDAYWQPKDLYDQSPNSYYRSNQPGSEGNILLYRFNSSDSRQNSEANIYAGGPVIKDRLFFFGVVSTKYTKQQDVSRFGNNDVVNSSSSPIYAFNLSGNIAEGHTAELITFSDERNFNTSIYDVDPSTLKPTALNSVNKSISGGANVIARYNGNITSWFDLSALYGHGYLRDVSQDQSSTGGPCTVATDRRDGGVTPVGCSPFDGNNRDYKDTRTSYRLDGTFSFSFYGAHSLKVGYDIENLRTQVRQSDASALRILRCATATCSAGTATVNMGDEYVRLRVTGNTGLFKNDLSAYYAEDNWIIGDTTLIAGVRVDNFNLIAPSGDSYIKINNNIGPRFGAVHDLFGNGKAKIFANAGRYYIPVETNTAFRNVAIGSDLTSFFDFAGFDSQTGAPVLGAQISPPSGQVTNGEGTPVSSTLNATSQDEISAGAQYEFAPKWTISTRGIYRNLRDALEDTCNKTGPNFTVYSCASVNPNGTISGVDLDGDGEIDPPGTLQDRGFPKLKRKYYGMEVVLERAFDRKWFFRSSYTLSHTFGNFEGFSNSEFGQDDAGITTAFDFAALTTNTYGDLPSDRRHKFKAYGAYNFTEEIQGGLNYSLNSGRPINKIGTIDNPTGDAFTGSVIGDYDGNFYVAPRGSVGRTPWISSIDLSLKYSPVRYFAKRATIGFDVLNLLGHKEVTAVNEISGDSSQTYDYYLQPDQYQAPRFVRLSFSYNWKQ